MSARPSELLARVAEHAPRVLVVGDAILDTWLSGTSRRISREAPVPVVEVTERRPLPGGAANTAVNLAALGALPRLAGAVGDDPEGVELRRALDTAGVDTSGLRAVPNRATVTKQRVCSSGSVLARWDRSAPERMPAGDAEALAARVDRMLPEADAVLIGDYGTGGVPDEVVELIRRRRDRIRLLVVDAHRLGRWTPTRPDVVTPNAGEVSALLGEPMPAQRMRWLRGERIRLTERAGAGAVVVTLDRDGTLLLPADPAVPAVWTGTVPAPESWACGAGDVFAAALTAALVSADHFKGDLPAVVRLAQAAAETAIAAGRSEGACTARVDVEALAARVAPPRRVPLTRAGLVEVVAAHRAAGRRIVFTNGCFDVLHRGHVAYLEQAKQLGDVLIVAVNSDVSVARLKGPDRPVNPEADRASVLSALRCVDHVVIFSEDTPIGLLELVRPEVYAKGGDYTPQMLPETPVVRRLGGEVKVLDYLSDHSTSAIVRRIRDRAVW